MLENSVYSVISPEGCAAILYKDPSRVEEAANNLKLSSQSLLKVGLIDGIIDEALGGAHRGPKETAFNLKRVVLETLEELEKLPLDELVEKRYEKFRQWEYLIDKVGKWKKISYIDKWWRCTWNECSYKSNSKNCRILWF